MSSNRLTKASAESLAEVLKTNTALSSVGMAENDVTWPGAKALLSAIEENTTLTALYLSANALGSSGLQDFVLSDEYAQILTSTTVIIM